MKDLSWIWRKLPKQLVFALFGGVGCLLGAVLAEPLLLLIPKPPPAPPAPKVDVLFVLDVTGSMRHEINGIRKGIGRFTTDLRGRNLEPRVGLIAFRDRFAGEEPLVLWFHGQPFTSDPRFFKSEMRTLRAVGGGDEPESSLDALALAAKQPFQPDASRVVVLITDAPPKVPDRDTRSVSLAVQALHAVDIHQLHIIVNDSDRHAFAQLRDAAPGEFFSLAEASSDRRAFGTILAQLGKEIAVGAGVLVGNRDTPAHSRRLALYVIAAWTALLGLGIFLLLVIGQNLLLQRRLFHFRSSVLGILGALLAGCVAGVAGQFLFAGAPHFPAIREISRVVAWGILGVLLGGGVSFVVPNLKLRRAMLGATIGGVLGACGFLWLAHEVGVWTGRLGGAFILGLFIGLMVALMEALFREAALELSWGPRERTLVNLGPKPLLVGSTPGCQIFVPGASGIVGTFTLSDGQVVYEDRHSRRRQKLSHGSQLQFGKLSVVIRIYS